MKYAIRTTNGLLDSICFGSYPTTKRLYFNEKTEKIEPKFTTRDFMLTSNSTNGYITFDNENEAKEYKDYLLHECEENRSRWDDYLMGCTDKVINLISKFKVIEVR
jgi:hypothetical protein